MVDEPSDTRDRILAAAEVEFLACGYDRSRMQAIADRAEVNKAALHYHFRSKDDLFAQIFRIKAELLFPKLDAVIQGEGDLLSLMCRFIDLYVAHLIENPFLPSYLFQVAMNQPELLQHIPAGFPQRFLDAFEKAAHKGEIRDHDPRQFVVSVMGMCAVPFVAKNLLKHVFRLDEGGYDLFLGARAEELKRYVTLILTPPPPRRKGR